MICKRDAMSAVGHSLPTRSASVSANVRYAPKSDHFLRLNEMIAKWPILLQK